jgi:pimeloyl-ACP methyl ester carboxylesterase
MDRSNPIRGPDLTGPRPRSPSSGPREPYRVPVRRTLGLGALLVAGAVGAGLLVPATPGAAAPPGSSPSEPGASAVARQAAEQVSRAVVPRVRWERCRGGGPARLSCSDVEVPLDYDRPAGPTLKLGLTRWRAKKPQRRTGSLFVNPGGPGGPAGGFVPYVGRALGTAVDRRFDVVGIDPRGTGRSGRVRCRGPVSPHPRVEFPVTPAQVRRQIAFDDRVRQACDENATRLVPHASTADNARDMELVRRALRERRISYYGISYGSYLGGTYAALFPQRIRAMVVDGVLDPVAWSSGSQAPPTEPFSTRVDSGAGAYEALTAAFDSCESVTLRRCALADGADEAWNRVVTAAREGRLRSDGGRVRYQEVVGMALGLLYDGSLVPELMTIIDDLDDAVRADPRARRVDVSSSDLERLVEVARRQRETGPWAPTTAIPATGAPRGGAERFDVVFPAVTCSDSANPSDPTAWELVSQQQDVEAPWFGRSWTWASSTCARSGIGSGVDSFRGPWRTSTAYPVLVVGNSHDPATPLSGAEAFQGLFEDSVLVRWNGWAHGALGQGACITDVMGRYLTRRKLPAEGTVCQPERPLFPRRGG